MKTLRRSLRLAAMPVMASGLLIAAPALAGTHYFCYLRDAYSDRGFYVSPILSTPIEDLDETWTGFKFSEYASANGLSMDAGSVQTGCVSSTSNPGYVREQHAKYPEWYPGIQQVDWPEPPVPSEPVEESAPTDALVIVPAEPSGPSPEVIAAWMKREREVAAENARKVAASMRASAEMQAQYEESRRRYRRRPGSQ
jgi:hypothetical protein